MTDHSTTSSNQDWLHLQQQYWEHWLTLTRQLFNLPASELNKMSATSPWGDALELWWQALAPKVDNDHHAVFRKFIDQGKIYFGFNQEFLKILQTLSDNHPTAEQDWQTLWESSFIELKDHFNRLLNDGKTGLGFWELPLENWQRTWSSLFNFPSDVWQQLQTEALTKGQQRFSHEWERWFSMPSVGYLQNWQTRYQARAKLWLNYQQAHEQYISLFSKIGILTVDLLRDKIVQLDLQGQSVNNLRATYDLWIDCGEIAYAKIASSDEYREHNANLINALMALKQHERQLMDELLSALNMPTRKDFDTLVYRMQQMRRELRARALPSVPDHSAVLAALQTEVEALRAELNALKTVPKKASNRTKKTLPKETPPGSPPTATS